MPYHSLIIPVCCEKCHHEIFTNTNANSPVIKLHNISHNEIFQYVLMLMTLDMLLEIKQLQSSRLAEWNDKHEAEANKMNHLI